MLQNVFGSVQGLKGQICEIQGNTYIHSVQELALHVYICVYVLITGISLFLEKQQQFTKTGNIL